MRPKIIHPVRIFLYKRLKTEFDDELGPSGIIEFDEPIELYGQVKYSKFESLVPVGEGNDPLNSGHIVFYAENFSGAVGDEMELEDSSRLIITEIRPAAHYHKKFYHLHVFFTRKRTR